MDKRLKHLIEEDRKIIDKFMKKILNVISHQENANYSHS